MTDPRRGTAAPITITLRPQVAAIALAMEAKLQQRDDREYWKDLSYSALYALLAEEVAEVYDAIDSKDFGNIPPEAVDVAICAMFLFDKEEK